MLGPQDAPPVAHSFPETATVAEAATQPPAAQPMVQAKRFFSAAILADPRSRQALEGLSQLAADERIVQLCNLEALEQVHRWRVDFTPDLFVAYATSDMVLAGRNLRADGAAFRSKGRWFNIKFGCAVAPDIKSVAAFEFQVGDEIPESEWAANFLSAGAEAHGSWPSIEVRSLRPLAKDVTRSRLRSQITPGPFRLWRGLRGSSA